jgi:predicted Zn-dependent peptidase
MTASSAVQQLPSGLQVYIHSVPNKVVTVDCWIATGSAQEVTQDHGTAHFLEHMLFKGTPRFAPGELDRAIMGVGGVWNAGTSKDFTHYYATVASPFWETALDCIVDMVYQPTIDRAEFDREKQVILEEWRRKQDTPMSVLYDELYEASFEVGPYRHGVLGSFESISALDRDRMEAFHHKFYEPSNMLLCVVGDVDPGQALEAVERRTAVLNERRRRGPRPEEPEPTRRNYGVRREVFQDVQEAYLGLTWPAPSVEDLEAVLALDLAMVVLGDGRSSRLVREIRERLALADSISCGAPTHRHDSLGFVVAGCSPSQVDAVEEATLRIFREFAQQGPTAQELSKARRILRNSHCFSTETNSGHSGMVGYSWTLTGDTELAHGYLDRMDALTAEDARNAMEQLLASSPEGPNRVVILPKDQNRSTAP